MAASMHENRGTHTLVAGARQRAALTLERLWAMDPLP
jgi:hypothetical protein